MTARQMGTASGLYRRTWRVCTVCGTTYRARRVTSRYCSVRCATQCGPWSYPVNAGQEKGGAG